MEPEADEQRARRAGEAAQRQQTAESEHEHHDKHDPESAASLQAQHKRLVLEEYLGEHQVKRRSTQHTDQEAVQ